MILYVSKRKVLGEMVINIDRPVFSVHYCIIAVQIGGALQSYAIAQAAQKRQLCLTCTNNNTLSTYNVEILSYITENQTIHIIIEFPLFTYVSVYMYTFYVLLKLNAHNQTVLKYI